MEKKLKALIKKCNLEGKITVDDIKNIIWNEKGKGNEDMFRLVGMFMDAAKSKDIEEANEITRVLVEAWNSFPHAVTGGVAPNDIISGKSKKEKAKGFLEKKGKSLQDIFSSQFPSSTRFVKIGHDKWGFEFPKVYFDILDSYYKLSEIDISAEEYERNLKKILSVMPEFFDAVSDLAELYNDNRLIKLAENLYEKHIAFGRSFIPPEFIPGKHKIIWAYMDNRPFLRLLANYAMFIESHYKASKAIPLYEELISINPNDNQGIRSLLATAYLKTYQLQKMLHLASQYPGDITPQIAMGKVVALIQLERFIEAERFLKRNLEFQKHVVKELLKTEHPKPKNLMEDRVTVGGEDEAYYYFLEQGALWRTTQGALEFLRKVCKT